MQVCGDSHHQNKLVSSSTLAFVSASLTILLGTLSPAKSQSLPTLESTTNSIDIRVGDVLNKGAWTLAPEIRPDIYEVEVPDGKTVKVTFISDKGQLSYDVRQGSSVDFNIVWGSTVCWTRIKGIKRLPAAIYDVHYRQSNKGKVAATVPEVYELINIAIALTEHAQKSGGLVSREMDYYSEMMAWFEPVKNDPLVTGLNKTLDTDPSSYFRLKMNGNSFEFDTGGDIVLRKEYNRTGFAGDRTNTLMPFLERMKSFAKASRFREFYAKHSAFYTSQCQFFLEEADLPGMCKWLQTQYPKTVPYDFVDVIFSPLVGWNQSSTWFESNGFKTLQPHVNFPYVSASAQSTFTPKAQAVSRGTIVFTEINHGYLSPASTIYRAQILKATTNVDKWLTKSMQQSYAGTAVFDEYMNWGLMPLWASDVVPADADQILRNVMATMERRGFKQFAEFQTFLIKLYRERKPGQTVWDYYPRIIGWFGARN